MAVRCRSSGKEVKRMSQPQKPYINPHPCANGHDHVHLERPGGGHDKVPIHNPLGNIAIAHTYEQQVQQERRK
jgi:hypothetical protein